MDAWLQKSSWPPAIEIRLAINGKCNSVIMVNRRIFLHKLPTHLGKSWYFWLFCLISGAILPLHIYIKPQQWRPSLFINLSHNSLCLMTILTSCLATVLSKHLNTVASNVKRTKFSYYIQKYLLLTFFLSISVFLHLLNIQTEEYSIAIYNVKVVVW